MRRLIFISLNLAITLNTSALDLSSIMSGNEFIGFQPHDIQWSHDSKTVYFRWNSQNETITPYYSLDVSTRKIKRLTGEEISNLPVNGYVTNKQKTHFYFQKGSAIYFQNKDGNQVVYANYSPFQIHQVLPNGDLVIQQFNNFYLFSYSQKLFKQLTNFNQGFKPSISSNNSYLINQQKELFEIVRQNEKRSIARNNFYDTTSLHEIETIYLNKNELSNLTFNESLNKMIFSIDEYQEVANTHIEEYITESGYSNSQTARPKVGSIDPTHEIFYFDFIKDSLVNIDIENLTGIYDRPLFLKEYEKEDFKPTYEKPKNVIFHNHGFNDRGDLCLIEIKSYDSKDRWITIYNTRKNELVEINHQHDEAWIGGPGISSWKFESGNCGWINDSEIFYQSEETGYSHLYLSKITSEGKLELKKQITLGNFEIHQAIYDFNKKLFYVTANKNHPGNREFYTLSLINNQLTPILNSDGYHDVYVSPDGKNLIDLYSYKNKPWEIYLGSLKENTITEQITNSQSENFQKYNWKKPEVVKFKAQDSTFVFARLYKPEEDKKNNAAIIFVHGAGYLQNAHNWWSSYYREYMFHNLMVDEGYTILDIDYRASEGYGRDFRTGIYRYMGGKDLSDQLDGRKYLINQLNIDSTRIGIYGGSYGGFITLMALLNHPGKFKCGAALRSVTDWAHYNHEYTSNILNTPETDPIAYKQSSPIYFAEGLQDELLILHGIEDDNVHYQDVVRLTQRFIELRKTTWNIVGYPIEPHGFVETSSWIDEYRRIRDLFNEQLLN